jgi:hypothetical protein
MKIITIEQNTDRKGIDTSDPNWKHNAYSHILTFLTTLKSGCIIAEWSRKEQKAVWNYAKETSYSLKPEKYSGEIFVQDNLSCFRMILAALGSAIIDNAYIGGGTFKIQFSNEKKESKLYAMIFANEKDLGYWIKLQVTE